MASREQILARLRRAGPRFPGVAAPPERMRMSPLSDTSRAALRARFIAEAEAVRSQVHQAATEAEAISIVLAILGEERSVISWAPDALPLPALPAALQEAGISLTAPGDPSARVGISGADAALAATGSLLLASGAGRFRSTSLLPPVHIALITDDHLAPDLESWLERQRADGLAAFRRASNLVIISGPSRSADIAMELILGMHGPGSLHIIFCDSCARSE